MDPSSGCSRPHPPLRYELRKGCAGWVVAAVLLNGALWLELSACSVPVFRYALERWPADCYEVSVFHRGALSADDEKVVAWLQKRAVDSEAYANFLVGAVDLDTVEEEQVRELWPEGAEPKLPHMVVRYPRSSRIPHEVWSGALSSAAAGAVLDSPARQEVARRLVSGDCAVWLFLESGNREADDARAAQLKAFLTKLEKELVLPPFFDPLDGGAGYPGAGAPGGVGYEEIDVGSALTGGTQEGETPEQATGETPASETEAEAEAPKGLRVTFSILRVSRADPREKHLVAMLLGSEPDLKTFTEPMAFPVFGRGRALFALVGKGITEDNVYEACSFLVAPCSCQVKALNPGTDLLMAVDWDTRLQDTYVEPEPPPPLVGMSSLQGKLEDGTGGPAASTVNEGAVLPSEEGGAAPAGSVGTAASGGVPEGGAAEEAARVEVMPRELPGGTDAEAAWPGSPAASPGAPSAEAPGDPVLTRLIGPLAIAAAVILAVLAVGTFVVLRRKKVYIR